jgi:hypothetical protein
VVSISREGKLPGKLLTMENRTRMLRPELAVNLERKCQVWQVVKFVYKHSHTIAAPDEVPFLWSRRKIKYFQRAEILAYAAA